MGFSFFSQLLAENNIMDYSFLLGVHMGYVKREETEGNFFVFGGVDS
jgi:hypothetical protein